MKMIEMSEEVKEYTRRWWQGHLQHLRLREITVYPHGEYCCRNCCGEFRDRQMHFCRWKPGCEKGSGENTSE